MKGNITGPQGKRRPKKPKQRHGMIRNMLFWVGFKMTWTSAAPPSGVKLTLSTTLAGARLAGCLPTDAGFDAAGFAVPPKKEATREAFSFSSFDSCSSRSFSSASRRAFSSSQLSSTAEFFRVGFCCGLWKENILLELINRIIFYNFFLPIYIT